MGLFGRCGVLLGILSLSLSLVLTDWVTRCTRCSTLGTFIGGTECVIVNVVVVVNVIIIIIIIIIVIIIVIIIIIIIMSVIVVIVMMIGWKAMVWIDSEC